MDLEGMLATLGGHPQDRAQRQDLSALRWLHRLYRTGSLSGHKPIAPACDRWSATPHNSDVDSRGSSQGAEKLETDAFEPIDGFSARKLRSYYLVNPEEAGDRHYRLILSQTDKDSLIALVAGGHQPKEHSIRITENFALFESWIADCKDDLASVCKGLAKLVVVDIALTRDQDNPQLIFESMNSTGRELTQADLIRNLHPDGAGTRAPDQLYKQFWRPMEVDFGQEAYTWAFDRFMRHYLTVKTGEIPNINEVYERSRSIREVIALSLQESKRWSQIFAPIFPLFLRHGARARETDPDLKMAFQDFAS